MWLSIDGLGFPAHIHIIPKDDEREHEAHPGCWCQPKPHPDPHQEQRIVHHAADGRMPYKDDDEIEYV